MSRESFSTRLFIFLILLSAALFLTTTNAFAGTVTNPRIPSSYSSIQSALDAAQAGDVLLCKGLFNEHAIQWPAINGITLKVSTESTACTIDAQYLGRAISVESAVGLTIEGITIIRGSVPSGMNGGGIYIKTIVPGTSLLLSKVNIKNCSAEGEGGVIYSNGSDITAESCVFSGNSAGSGGVASGGNWDVSSCEFSSNHANAGDTAYAGVAYGGSWTIKNSVFRDNVSSGGGGVASYIIAKVDNCLFYGNRTTGFAPSDNGGVFHYCSWEVADCVFYNNSTYGIGGVADDSDTTGQRRWTARNSVFWKNSSGVLGYPVFSLVSGLYMVNTFGLSVTYSDVQNIGTITYPAYMPGTGNISSEPGFISTVEGSYDFRLNLDSICIDKGTMETGIPTSDIAGNTRPRNYFADIGAYEFQGPSLKVLSPNGGENYLPGSKINITWYATDEGGISPHMVTLEYSSDSGANWSKITTEVYTATYSIHTWEPVESISGNKFLIKVSTYNLNNIYNYDISDGVFSILKPYVYVSPAGSDSNTGTLSSPYRTVQKGLDIIATGGTIYLMTGTHTVDAGDPRGMMIWPEQQNVTLTASPGATGTVTIDAQKKKRAIYVDLPFAVSMTIEGITITRGVTKEPGGAFYTTGGPYPQHSTILYLWNCTVTNCSSEGTGDNGRGGGIYAKSSVTIFADNCVFSHNSAYRGGFMYNNTGNIYATNSIFAMNAAQYGGVLSAGPIGSVLYPINCVFIGNTAVVDSITENTGPPYYYTLFIGRNNIAWGNGANDNLGIGNPAASRFSDIQAYDPLFVSTTEGNPGYLWLKMGSPCIDTASIEAPATDRDGNRRPKGFGNDMGVFEFPGPFVRVFSPNGGELYAPGENITIIWVATDETYGILPNSITIEYSTNEGATWNYMTTEANTGIYTWEGSLVESVKYLISVEATNASSEPVFVCDVSNDTFCISNLFAEVFISPNGSDEAGTGTIEAPFRTVQKGVNSVIPRGKVKMLPGIYSEEGDYNVIWPVWNGITLQLSPDATQPATMDAHGAGRFISVEASVDLTIESITMQYGKTTAAGANGYGGAIYLKNIANLWLNNVIIQYCSVEGTNSNGGAVSSTISFPASIYASNSTFRNNRAIHYGGVGSFGKWIVTNCTFESNMATDFGGVYYYNTWNVIGSTFKENSGLSGGGVAYNGTGIATNCSFSNNSGAGGGGVANNMTLFKSTNCTFYGNSATANGGVFKDGLYNSTNCIFWGNTASITPVFDAGTYTVNYSDFQTDGWPANGLTECISKEPDFVSVIGTDPGFLKLNWDSPCIDSGTSEGAPSDDLAGDPRPHRLGYDMGAYEYQGPAVRVDSPNGGEILTAGQYVTIEYTVTDETYGILTNSVTIEYSTNEGASWTSLATVAYTGFNGSYNWLVPDILSSNCLISVKATNGISLWSKDVSDAKFSIKKSVVYVSDNMGNNTTGTGTIQLPFKTIQKGLDSVGSYGVVFVMSGLYTGEANGYNIIWPSVEAVYLGISPDASAPVTIDAQGKGGIINVASAETLIIDGITMKNGNIYSTPYQGGAICLNYDGGGSCTLMLNKVIISGCSATDESYGYGGAVYSHGSIVIAQNCIFHDNTTKKYGGVAYSGSWIIESCTFFRNLSIDDQGGVAYGSTWFGENSIFWDNGTDFRNVTQILNYSNNDQDPKFVSTVYGNAGFLRLGPGSPCIDSAYSIPPAPTSDAAGNIRPKGFANDMGAYEFQGPSISVESPNGGELYPAGYDFTITWIATDETYGILSNSVTIEYSTNEGASWDYITTEANDGIFTWEAPMVQSTQCVVSVKATNGSSLWNYDVSDGTFSILTVLQNVYISPTGSDEAGTGTIEAPFRTVQKGLDSTAPGGEVRMLGGVYSETGDHNITWPVGKGKVLKHAAEATSPATIDAGGIEKGIVFGGDTVITIEGITIQNCYSNGDSGAGIYAGGGSALTLHLKDVTMKNCTAEGFTGGAVYVFSSTLVVEDSQFIGNNAYFGGAIGGAGYDCYAYNCLFIHNGANSYGGVAFDDFAVASWKAVNCDFYNNTVDLGGGGVAANIAAWEGVNCIYWDNIGSYWGVVFTTLTTYNKQYYSNIQKDGWEDDFGVPLVTSHCISSEPLFISTSDPYDLHMLLTSECIDSGTFEGAPTMDAVGVSRPQPSTYPLANFDMGCYEQAGIVDITPPVVTAEAPITGETVSGGSKYIISWEATDDIGFPTGGDYISIYLSIDDGSTWLTLTTTEENDNTLSGTFEWTVPLISTTECRISIEARDKKGNLGYGMTGMFSIEAGGMGSRIYVIKYNNETANEDWVAVPFESSGITNTEQLINSIGSRYTPVAGESMIVTLRSNADQVNDSRSMTYMGGVWLPDNEDDPYIAIPVGSAASVVISKAGGRSGIDTTWEVSGVIPVSQTYNIVYNNETANEDRVMDYYGSGITNTEQLINSIGGKYSPVAGESMIVTLRSNADQVNNSRSMTYMGGVWLPDNEDDPYIAIGEYDPCSVVISKAGGRSPISTTWP